MRLQFFATVLVMGLSGCSGSSGLTTGSIFGGGGSPKTDAAPTSASAGEAVEAGKSKTVVPTSTPSARALQVGAVSARAQKCGYNFDAVKLRTTYLLSEQQGGATPEDLTKLERVYDVAVGGVSKVAAEEENFCSTTKTASIKKDLARHLSGDFSPAQRTVEADEDGLFSGLFSGNGSSTMSTIKPSTANGF